MKKILTVTLIACAAAAVGYVIYKKYKSINAGVKGDVLNPTGPSPSTTPMTPAEIAKAKADAKTATSGRGSGSSSATTQNDIITSAEMDKFRTAAKITTSGRGH